MKVTVVRLLLRFETVKNVFGFRMDMAIVHTNIVMSSTMILLDTFRFFVTVFILKTLPPFVFGLYLHYSIKTALVNYFLK